MCCRNNKIPHYNIASLFYWCSESVGTLLPASITYRNLISCERSIENTTVCNSHTIFQINELRINTLDLFILWQCMYRGVYLYHALPPCMLPPLIKGRLFYIVRAVSIEVFRGAPLYRYYSIRWFS